MMFTTANDSLNLLVTLKIENIKTARWHAHQHWEKTLWSLLKFSLTVRETLFWHEPHSMITFSNRMDIFSCLPTSCDLTARQVLRKLLSDRSLLTEISLALIG